MPCDSSYLEPTQKERELQRAARLIMYVHSKLALMTPGWIVGASTDQYAHDERVVPYLCALLGELPRERREAIVYNAHDPASRALADWWEEHLAADAARARGSEQEMAASQAREAALAKLTPDERRLLKLE